MHRSACCELNFLGSDAHARARARVCVCVCVVCVCVQAERNKVRENILVVDFVYNSCEREKEVVKEITNFIRKRGIWKKKQEL